MSSTKLADKYVRVNALEISDVIDAADRELNRAKAQVDLFVYDYLMAYRFLQLENVSKKLTKTKKERDTLRQSLLQHERTLQEVVFAVSWC